MTQNELKDINIPFTWVAQYTGLIHGIAAWFDINLGGYVLSTAPHAEKTHWHQVRLMLKEPLAVNAFETVHGFMRMKANTMRSYDITAEMVCGNHPLLAEATGQVDRLYETRKMLDGFTRRSGKWALHEQTYYFEQYAPDSTEQPELHGLYQADDPTKSSLNGVYTE